MPKFYTRSDYLHDLCSHREYYRQFVTLEVAGEVLRHFSIYHLQASYALDPNFNTIPLNEWDQITLPMYVRKMMESRGDYLTEAGAVCILKEAALEFLEFEKLFVEEEE